MRKTRRNKQKTPGNGDGGSTSEAPQPPRKKGPGQTPQLKVRMLLKIEWKLKVKIPEELKPWLVEDWDLVTRQKQLSNSQPRKTWILFWKNTSTAKDHKAMLTTRSMQLMKGGGRDKVFQRDVGHPFNSTNLKAPVCEILLAHPDAPVSQVYGAPHLLRLFVRIGAMLAYTPLDEEGTYIMVGYLHDFLKYCKKMRL